MSPSDPRTRLIAQATRRTPGRRPVNPPIERASTLLNDDAGRLADTSLGPVYGLDGLTAARELRRAIADLEGAADAWLTPSGLSAVTVPLLALTQPGDEILTTDGVYWPSRRFLTRYMAARGVTTRFHPADADTDAIVAMMSDATRVLLIESPASLTFEMVDVAALARAAAARGIQTVMDNTWAAGLAFQPLDHGVDVSVQALTKYAAGHSDVLMGSIAANDDRIRAAIEACIEDLGWHVSPDDAWLALRGLRTLPLRYAEHGRSALEVAAWLQHHPAVEAVLYPPLPGSVAHALWVRSYSGAGGLIGCALNTNDKSAALSVLNNLSLFGLGYSWGGFESLATYETPQLCKRSHASNHKGSLLRLHIGLESPEDLIGDLEAGLAPLKTQA